MGGGTNDFQSTPATMATVYRSIAAQCSFYSPGVLLAVFAPVGYGPGPAWFIIPCMLFIPGPYGEPVPIMPWAMLG